MTKSRSDKIDEFIATMARLQQLNFNGTALNIDEGKLKSARELAHELLGKPGKGER